MVHEWMGWCPNAPVIRTAPAALLVPPENIHPAQSGDGGSAGSSSRIRSGVCIATGSLKAMFRDRRLLWFMALAGLAMVFLIIAEGWNVTHPEYILPSYTMIPIGDVLIFFNARYFNIDINSGDFSLSFDNLVFVIEMLCLSCFTILLAALVIYRTGKFTHAPLTIRKAFAGVSTYISPLVILSITMALSGTILLDFISHSQFFGKIIMTVSMAVFNLPYAYYLQGSAIDVALYFSFKIMFINIVLFLVALYVVPFIVLENKGLVPALTGSAALVKKTWRELLGCVLVYGAIVLGVFAVALVIGQSPLLLNHDYDFFINMSRGQLLMMTVCFLFLTACWVMMAAGFTAAGIAITDLYAYGKTGQVSGGFEKK
jgi:hypothetical protein